MKIIGGDGSGGYGRTRPGRSIVAYQSRRKIVRLHKKVSAPLGTYTNVPLTRSERVTLLPCAGGTHRKCQRVIVNDGELPKVCDCACHVDKRRKAKRSEVLEIPNTVTTTYYHDDVANQKPEPKRPRLMGSMKALYKKYAKELARGKELSKDFQSGTR